MFRRLVRGGLGALVACAASACSGGGDGNGGGGGAGPSVVALPDASGDGSHPTIDLVGYSAGCDADERPWAVLAFASPDLPPQNAHEWFWRVVLTDALGADLELVVERYEGVDATLAFVDGVETTLPIEAQTAGATRHVLVDQSSVIGCPVAVRARSLFLATDSQTSIPDLAPDSGSADVSAGEAADPTDAGDRASIDAALADAL